jgi:hypothetical protein
MEFNKKQSAFLYLDKKGFYFYSAGMQSVLSLSFLETSVKDMDVINGAELMAQIKSFIEQYQVPQAIISIILSPNVTFEKDLADLTHEAQEEQEKKFIDTIPFESVLSKSYPIEKGIKVIGFNEDLYSELKISFEKNKFSVENVIPYQFLGNDQALVQNLTNDNASQLLKRIGSLKQYTLITVEKEKPQQSATITPATTSTTLAQSEKPKSNKVRLYLMIGVFAVLFAILGFMLLKR